MSPYTFHTPVIFITANYFARLPCCYLPFY